MIDSIGLAAGFFVILAFYARSGLWLRIHAVTSNILFLVYALQMQLWPILVLHVILLLLNLSRLWELSDGGGNLDNRMTDKERTRFLGFVSIGKGI